MRPRDCHGEEEIQENQERNHQVNLNQTFQQQHNPPSLVPPSSSSRQWTSAFRNPRIVRVSRAFPGKDRHSKVCTIRGLRDRRIRLSVPTAIQLYDLQDRLGLSQPSKVIDWLLQEAKDDVDKLPPLQFPHGINQLYPNLFFGESSLSSSSSASAFSSNNLGFLESFDLGGSSSRTGSRIADLTTTTRSNRECFDLDKGKWIKHDENSNHQNHGFDINHHHHHHHHLNNPYNNGTASHYNLGHVQQYSLDQSGNNVTVAISNVVSNNNNNNLNLHPPGEGSHQQLFGHHPPIMSSLFPTYPSFLGASHHQHHHHVVDGGGNLELFNSSSNTVSSQQHMMTGNSNLMRPFHHLMSSNHHDTDRHSGGNDSDS